MLGEEDRATYTQGLVNALRVMGPQPRGYLIRMLRRSVTLEESEAEDVIRYALARGALIADGDKVRVAEAA